MINRRNVRAAYENVVPTDEQKARMLSSIRSRAKPSVSVRKTRRFIWLAAALMILLTATVVSASEPIKQWIQLNESISNEHQSVTVNISIDEEITGEVLPLIEVKPYFFTGEDVHRVAKALFPGADFFEYEPDSVKTKEQIQSKLNRWERYTTASAVEELIGYDPMKPDWPGEIAKMVQRYVEIYEKEYETALSVDQRIQCRWEFQNEIYYMYTQEEIKKENPLQFDSFNQGIQTTLIYDGIPYTLIASQRDMEDYKVNNISARIDDGFSPKNIDWEIFLAQFCCTEEPTEEQLENVKQKAKSILDQMGMGQWMIDECYVRERIAGNKEYIIHINAVPVFLGIPAVRCLQIDAIRNLETGEKDYYYTDINFQFSANGDLLWFELYSPVTISNITQAEKDQLSVNELLEIAKDYLMTDAHDRYNIIPNSTVGDGNYYCVIDVTSLDYSLSRVKGNGEYIYIYTPGMTLTGNIRYYEKGTDKLLREITDHIFLIMDGLDGTIKDGIN